MLREILITSLVMVSMTESSIAYDLKDAKIGSTVIIDWSLINIGGLKSADGHAAVVVSEYSTNIDSSFIVGAHGDGVKYDSYNDHIGTYNHLGHFRSTSENYSFAERNDIATAAKKLIGKDYEFLNLYVYGTYANYFNDNIPVNRNTVPSDLRCDGVAEWATEVSVNNGTPKKADGFYESNNPLSNKPMHITKKQVDNVGTPQKPTLSLINNNKVSIKFSKVDGAWSRALYAVYRGEDNAYQSTVPKKIHCSSGHNTSYIDENIESGLKYYYLIRVGERTASCNDLPEYSNNDASNWSKVSDSSIIEITDSVSLASSIIDGAGSIINPSNSCWGCDKDEADMQVHSSNPSTVVFQWKQTSSCPYLDIGILECGSDGCGVSNNENLDVVIHRKKWNSATATAFKTTLPVTVRKKDSWNTISITSQKPISSTKKIVAFCSNNIVHSPTKQSISSSRVNLESGYVWAGNSSIISRSNPTLTQSDAIYKDVAISLSNNKAITLFQWQPSDTCSSLRLKAGFYPNGDGASSNVKFVDMKNWSNKVWSYRKQCNGRLPCTLNSPSGASGYYIIRVKTDANAINGNYISAFCQ